MRTWRMLTSTIMKTDIHPQTFMDCKVTCSCGASFIIASTLPEMKVEICSHCHPFYTGKQKLVDTEGRVDKFRKRQEAAAKAQAEKTEKAPKAEKKEEAKKEENVEEKAEVKEEEPKKEEKAETKEEPKKEEKAEEVKEEKKDEATEEKAE